MTLFSGTYVCPRTVAIRIDDFCRVPDGLDPGSDILDSFGRHCRRETRLASLALGFELGGQSSLRVDLTDALARMIGTIDLGCYWRFPHFWRTVIERMHCGDVTRLRLGMLLEDQRINEAW
jgi:hypothetical protein